MQKRYPADDFVLGPPAGGMRALAAGWLLLAVGSLAVGGLCAAPLLLSRIPGIQDFFPSASIFHTTLVMHADLSVLVWLVSFGGVLWTINSTEQCSACGWSALILAVAGTAIIVAAPFLGAGVALGNGYVPVLVDPVFFAGLGLFALGFTLLILRGLLFSVPMDRQMSGEGALSFGLYTGLLAALIAILAFVWSYSAVPRELEDTYYFEFLFWGSGHVIQFTHTQLMLVAWLWLATASDAVPKLSPRVVVVLFALGISPTLLTPIIYLSFDVASPDHGVAFNLLMKYGGGLAAVPLGLAVIQASLTAAPRRSLSNPLRSSLLFSVLLFGAGGTIGFMIGGSGLAVSAHLHGSVAAVTLAFMGLTYHLLPRLGFRSPERGLASWQPMAFGSGQLLHLLGLAWSGGNNDAAKVFDAAQGLESAQGSLGMSLMGLGGLLAFVGGLLFLIVVFLAVRPSKWVLGRSRPI